MATKQPHRSCFALPCMIKTAVSRVEAILKIHNMVLVDHTDLCTLYERESRRAQGIASSSITRSATHHSQEPQAVPGVQRCQEHRFLRNQLQHLFSTHQTVNLAVVHTVTRVCDVKLSAWHLDSEGDVSYTAIAVLSRQVHAGRHGLWEALDRQMASQIAQCALKCQCCNRKLGGRAACERNLPLSRHCL